MNQELIQSALWLIIDPWQYQIQQKSSALSPHQQWASDAYLNIVNHYHRTKIAQYLTHWAPKHLYVSSPPHIETGHKFKHIPVLQYTDVEKKVVDENFTEVVYTGFHYGMCINYESQGIQHIHKFAKCYVVKDLVCLFPGESWIAMDKETEKYATII